MEGGLKSIYSLITLHSNWFILGDTAYEMLFWFINIMFTSLQLYADSTFVKVNLIRGWYFGRNLWWWMSITICNDVTKDSDQWHDFAKQLAIRPTEMSCRFYQGFNVVYQIILRKHQEEYLGRFDDVSSIFRQISLCIISRVLWYSTAVRTQRPMISNIVHTSIPRYTASYMLLNRWYHFRSKWWNRVPSFQEYG